MDVKISFIDLLNLDNNDTEKLMSIVSDKSDGIQVGTKTQNGLIFETKPNKSCRTAAPEKILAGEKYMSPVFSTKNMQSSVSKHQQSSFVNGDQQETFIDDSEMFCGNKCMPEQEYSPTVQYAVSTMPAHMPPLLPTTPIYVQPEMSTAIPNNVYTLPHYNYENHIAPCNYNSSISVYHTLGYPNHTYMDPNINKNNSMPQEHPKHNNKNWKMRAKFKNNDSTNSINTTDFPYNSDIPVPDPYPNNFMCVYSGPMQAGYDPRPSAGYFPPYSMPSTGYSPVDYHHEMAAQNYPQTNQPYPTNYTNGNPDMMATMQHYPHIYSQYNFPQFMTNGCEVSNAFNDSTTIIQHELPNEDNHSAYFAKRTEAQSELSDGIVQDELPIEQSTAASLSLSSNNRNTMASDLRTEPKITQMSPPTLQNIEVVGPMMNGTNNDLPNNNVVSINSSNKDEVISLIEKRSKNKNRKKKKKQNKELASGSSVGDSGNNTRTATPALKTSADFDFKTPPCETQSTNFAVGVVANDLSMTVLKKDVLPPAAKTIVPEKKSDKTPLTSQKADITASLIALKKTVGNVSRPNTMKKGKQLSSTLKKAEKHMDEPSKLKNAVNQVAEPSKLKKVESHVAEPAKVKRVEHVTEPSKVKKVENLTEPSKVKKVESHLTEPYKLQMAESQVTESSKLQKAESHVTEPFKLQKTENDTAPSAWGKNKSWSTVFDAPLNQTAKKAPTISPENHNDCNNIEIQSTMDVASRIRIAEIMSSCKNGHSQPHLLPRGLINKSIWCYTNCLLQALMGCSPFLSMMQLFIREIPDLDALDKFPFLSSVAKFINMYSDVSEIMKPSHKGKVKPTNAVETATPCEPVCIYNLLLTVGSYQFKELNQQDAQEALNFILNGLHEEIADCLGINGCPQPDSNEDGDDWQVKGPKGKSCVTRTTPFHQTPFSEIFWGEFRSMQTANGTNSANIQPFNTLLLDVQSPKVRTLEDAFDQLVSKEEISGYTCSKTKKETTVVKQGLLQSLPKVLILHLNRFTYGEKGLLKDNKRVDFDVHLEIRKDLIHQNRNRKDKKNERTYTLFAVVKHEGPIATKGHYICEVYHGSSNKWLLCDDSNIKAITIEDVLKYDRSLVPYLLFYQRNDTIHSYTNGN